MDDIDEDFERVGNKELIQFYKIFKEFGIQSSSITYVILEL